MHVDFAGLTNMQDCIHSRLGYSDKGRLIHADSLTEAAIISRLHQLASCLEKALSAVTACVLVCTLQTD